MSAGLPHVSLPGTGIATSTLGFGCSALLGPLGKKEAYRLLETAEDCGVTHFDVARSYAAGDAEGVVGDFLATGRERVTVTTKFGIEPRVGSSVRRFLRPAARRVMQISPAVRRFLGRQSARSARTGRFTVEDASRSLEESLRQLRTDYVDVYLLHDCRAEDCSLELLSFLDRAVEEGKVRAYGVGTGFDDAVEIAAGIPAFARVLQLENSVVSPNLDRIDTADRAVITHGALVRVNDLRQHLEANPGLREEWSMQLGVDCAEERTLAALMLSYALRAASTGPVLFSTTRVENIVANTATARKKLFTEEQLALFARLVNSAQLRARS